MSGVLLRLAGAFGFWLLCLALVVPLLLAATVMALRDMAAEARRKRREKTRVNREIREFERELKAELNRIFEGGGTA